MYVYSWFIVLRESLLTVRLAVSEIKPVQSLTDRQTDRLTDRNVNYSNSRCACARGLITQTHTQIAAPWLRKTINILIAMTQESISGWQAY